jgi:NTP pyrophosphatase (non-canonical NTP hydrolase)
MKTWRMKMKTTGMKNNVIGEPENGSLSSLFQRQIAFQMLIADEVLPKDDLQWFSYHVQAMVEEMGEILKADKRWKTHRNTNYDPANKLEELSDAFITLMNLAIFSGFDSNTMYNAIMSKMHENFKKLVESRENK